MNKEPVALYIFRFIMGLGLFVFMCMLYWSSELIEKDLKSLKRDLASLKDQTTSTRIEVQKTKSDLLETILDEQRNQQELLKNLLLSQEKISSLREHLREENTSLLPGKDKHLSSSLLNSKPQSNKREPIDPSFPNLLSKDLFYTKTLPQLLGEDFTPKGTMRVATIGTPENLHPFNGFRDVSNMNSMCNVVCAGMEFGRFETMSSQMAIKIEERPSMNQHSSEYWVHLRNDVYWQPLEQRHFPEELVLAPQFLKKHQVTAHDFKFYFDALMNPNVQLPGAVSLRNYLGDIEEFRIIDDFTFSVRWKSYPLKNNKDNKIKYAAKGLTGSLRPLARFVYQYFPDGTKIIEEDKEPNSYRQNSVWAQNFSEHWAKNVIPSCGPWIFDGMSDERILFKRNPDYFDPYAALTNKIEMSFKETTEAVWQDFKSGKIDYYYLRPNQLIELEEFLLSDEYSTQKEKGQEIHRLDYVSRAYNYVGWNEAKPWFQTPKVRQAMTMAIDRARIIRQNLNGMGIELTGPFFPYSPSYDKNIDPLPYDLDEARDLLEEDGWFDSDGDGILNKEIEGKRIPFEFSLTYYVKNPTTKINCEYIATALKELGVKCNLNGVDIADLSNAFDEKDFDAIYLGWALGSPPEEPKQLWHSSGAKEKGSSNAIGFINHEADQIIDNLQYEYDLETRRKLYHRFHAIIHQEAPYTFLYTPKTTLLYRDYVQNVFIPTERQDLIPQANVPEPSTSLFWLRSPPQ